VSTCTYACATDADCTNAAHVLIERDSPCIGGVCRRVRQSGVACDDDVQCSSGVCLNPGFNGIVGTGNCR
jgi:hypothetical protein